MKTLKYFLFGLAGLICLVLILALFVDRKMTGEARAYIDKPKWEVFEYARDIKNQEEYGVWFRADTNMMVSSHGRDGEEGYVFRWESDVMGNGTQKIIKIVSQDTVLTELDFGFGEPAMGYTYLAAITPEQTEVTWGVKGQTPYPFNVMNLFMNMDYDFEKGVATMKEILEARPDNENTELFQYYKATEKRLIDNVVSLSPAQLQYRLSDSSWTIAECVEHIGLTEKMIFGMIQDFMKQPTNPEDRSQITSTDEDIKKGIIDRSQKFNASGNLVPEGEVKLTVSLDNWRQFRDTIYQFIFNTPEVELRNRVNEMPVGHVDVYQSMLFLAGHTLRHTLQIEEIKASEGFPLE